MEALQKKLNYRFRNDELPELALTHRSMERETNERLEFLGDSILNAVISAYLYKQFPQIREGEMSQIRSRLVDKQTLLDIAVGLNLAEHVRHAKVIKKETLRREPMALLADALEAIIGAIYLDGGWEKCQKIVLALYKQKLAVIDIEAGTSYKDSKTRLQELAIMRYGRLPIYGLLTEEGPAHKKSFTVFCDLPSGKRYVGQGQSIKEAEKEAAARALEDSDA